MVLGMPQNRTNAQDAETQKRLQVALRIKAARALAGGLRPTTKGVEAGPMTVAELAEHELIVANKITKNRLDAYEQLNAPLRPMELRVIAQALNVDPQFLLRPLEDDAPSIEDRVQQIHLAVQELRDQLSGDELVSRVENLEQQVEQLVDTDISRTATQELWQAGRRTGIAGRRGAS